MRKKIARLNSVVIFKMIKILFTIFILTFIPLNTKAEYLNRFQCRQNISTIENATLEYIKLGSSMTWYRLENSKMKFGDFESDIVSYMFWGDIFYGIEIGVIGNENISNLIRFFHHESVRIYKNEPDLEIFTYPAERKDGSWVYIFPDEVVIVRRFSVHLGQVQVLCRDLWAEHADVPELKKKSN